MYSIYCANKPRSEELHNSVGNNNPFFKVGTINFLNFWMLENFDLPKIQTKRPNLRVFHQKGANDIANKEDPDRTAPLGAV